MKTALFLAVAMFVLRHRVSDSTMYTVDDRGGYGRRFDGLGALSAGASSHLLVNYPEQQKREILDYLFKPNYGASLQIFKVEIGGDAQSTDGAEASHMHESWDENYLRGYEWWLMVEAKKRNPDILLYGLPWAFPAWIGNRTYNAFSNNEVTADYIIRWITAAQTYYNLQIDLIGIWNERNYSSSYIKTFRKMLDSRGLGHVRICAPDMFGWDIAEEMRTDPELAASVDYIGAHYPNSFSTEVAVDLNKPLWSSEDHGYGAYDTNAQGACRARMLNLNYINGFMTSTISWSLITSYYDGLPDGGSGLMTAKQPWSGHYEVNSAIWVTAHTTQFTKPGWKYLKHGSGVGKLTGGGSYVAFTDQEGKELTIVIETMANHMDCINSSYAEGPQNATFQLTGGFASLANLNVWYTKLGFGGNPNAFFRKAAPLSITGGIIGLTLGVDEIYTLTTVTTGQKGTSPDPPPSRLFPLPYKDNFEEYSMNYEPNNFAQQVGVWEVVQAEAPHGAVIRQMVLNHPVYWCWGGEYPKNNTLNVIGNFSWADISVQVDARVGEVNGTDGVYVAARIDRGGCHSSLALGIFFFVFPDQSRYELTNDLARVKLLKTGQVKCNGRWNTLALFVQGDRTAGFLNGKLLFNVSTPAQPSRGFVGLGTVPYGIADFDNFELTESSENRPVLRRH